jgi:4-amino-4-deoxy-L-arabinose transferase-like glycosyltransferase
MTDTPHEPRIEPVLEPLAGDEISPPEFSTEHAESPPQCMPTWQRIALAIVAVAMAAAMYAPSVVGVPLYTKGEPREALVMQTILRTGKLALPLRNLDEIPSKPPLFHWIGAALSLPNGSVTETSAKLPSAIASVLTIAGTLLFALRHLGTPQALLATVVLATSAQWVSSSSIARVDMVLATAISLGLFGFYGAYAKGRAIPWYCYAAGAAAVLAKGPIGLVLPGAIIFVFLVARRDWNYLWNSLNLRAAFFWICVALSWYAAAAYSGGEAFVEKLILRENILRVLDAEAGNVGHDHPFYWYGPALLAGSAPWCLFLPLALWRALRESFSTLSTSPVSTGNDSDSNIVSGRTSITFALIWFVITCVIFSLADSKRGVYLIPAYPAMALLIADAIATLLVRARDAGTRTPLTLVTWIGVTGGIVALPWLLILLHASGVVSMSIIDPIISESDRRNLGPIIMMIDNHASALAGAGIAASLMAITSWVFARRGAWRAAVATTSLALALTFALGGGFFLREIAEHQTPRDFMPEVLEAVGEDIRLYSFGRTMYGEIFYGEQPITLLSDTDAIVQTQATWVLVDQSELESFEQSAEGMTYRQVLSYDYKGHPRADPLLLMHLEEEKPQAEGSVEAPAAA